MEEETIQHRNYEEFLVGNSMPSGGDFDLMEREDNEVPAEVIRDNRRLWTAGLISLIAGAGAFIVSNFGVVSETLPWILGAGIIGMGLGTVRLIGKVMRHKTLSLPKLELRRKTEKTSQNAMSAFSTTGRSGRLAKSETDKVIMGVCGGMAAQSGINATLIRAAFILAFAFTSGVAAIFYIALGLFLPTGPKELPQKRG